jgi:hypothetical protein
MKSTGWLLIALFSLLVVSCSPEPKVTEFKEFIIGKWQGSGAPFSSTNREYESQPSSMEFTQAGRIMWDMGTQDKTLHFTGNYTFIAPDTIRVDFTRYSSNSAVWELTGSRMPNEPDSLTVRDRDAGTEVATMQRM